jgi:hypothetical protein
MANPVGSGSAIVMPLSSRTGGLAREYGSPLDELTVVRQRASTPPAVAPEILALLERIVAAVTGPEEGLTAVELREMLSERPERLQRALTAGLRGRRIRRSGSRCQTRYLPNQ